MNFKQKLNNYAKLLVHQGLNVQPGQSVNITGEAIHKDLMSMVALEAYKRGAKFVNVDFVDPWLTRYRILNAESDDDLAYVPKFIPVKFDEIVDSNGAVLRFQGSEEPDLLADLPADKMNKLQLHYRQSLKRYYQEGVTKSKIHWTVAGAATPKWGKKIFPDLSDKKACRALWEEIFKICRVDKPDFLERWKLHDATLHARSKALTKLNIKELHFTGPGTDLKVYLSPKAIFKGGTDISARGVPYEPNIPTEECFTTPDYRGTTGKAKVTRPFLVNGKLIKGLTLTFKNGVITHFHADEGQETFSAYIDSDAGGRRLGEVALVGTDSPIYQSGKIFEEILFDENAACHIAVGMAYRFCVEGGDKMTDAELAAIGCNDSHVHTDMMISSDEVDVYATTYDGQHLPLIVKGKWVFAG